jgi:hypothetical protein
VTCIYAPVAQLDALMHTLEDTDPHYVRCVKPNDMKAANTFKAMDCLDQLKYAGVFEAVKIRQQGFPFRWSHEVFFKRYRSCGDAYKRFPRKLPGPTRYPDLCRSVRGSARAFCVVVCFIVCMCSLHAAAA